jgi:hypothetical protein
MDKSFIEKLHENFEYIDGSLFWKVSPNKKSPLKHIGKRAGCLDRNGYVKIRIDNKLYLEHRLIWVLHNSSIGNNQMLDHINCVKHDNRIENLRIASFQQNHRNRKAYNNSASIYKGVSRNTQNTKWRATAVINNKQHWLGQFDLEEDAACAYNLFALQNFGEFAKLNCYEELSIGKM